jgi:hypothetical protein
MRKGGMLSRVREGVNAGRALRAVPTVTVHAPAAATIAEALRHAPSAERNVRSTSAIAAGTASGFWP